MRNPLERAFSHYRMLVGLSRETQSFEKVIHKEIKAYREGTLNWYSYMGMSFYREPVTLYKKYFKDVMVINFEDFIRDKSGTANRIFEFLSLEPLVQFQKINTNPTRNLHFKWPLYLLKKLGIKDYFSAIFSSRFKQSIFKWLSNSKKKTINLKPKTLSSLNEIFEKESLV